MSYLTPDTHCPSCGETLDAVIGLETPEPDCMTICEFCCAGLIFNGDMSLSRMPDTDPRAARLAQACAMFAELKKLLRR